MGLFLMNSLKEDRLVYYHEQFTEYKFFFPKEMMIDFILFFSCDIGKNYISHSIAMSYQADINQNIDLKYETNRLKKAFRTCSMKQQEIFFNQIDKNQVINLNNFLTEKEQIENILNYYYFIEPNSLLHEMQKKNYQSQDALLIMEKLKIDIQWQNYQKINKRG